MTIYFAGGEDHDFTKIGICSVDTATAAARRTANARCSLKVGGSGGTIRDGWTGTLSSAQTSFWLTARFYAVAASSASSELLCLSDATGVRRIVIGNNSSLSGMIIATRNAAGTTTTLATSAGLLATGSLMKIDVFVNYAASGTIQFYVDGTLVLSYSGNLITDAASSLSSFTLGLVSSGSGGYWSEVICSDSDTRFMSLITLAPTANGNTYNWDSGSVSSINETTLDDSTVITSGTVGQVAQFTVNANGMTGNVAVKALVISARAGKGATGPQNAKMNVRTGGADYSTSAIALQGASVARIQGVFSTNPGTGNAWTNAELTAPAFNIGIVSDT